MATLLNTADSNDPGPRSPSLSGENLSQKERYHLEELRKAQDPNNPDPCLPPPVPASYVILDVGCGAGQTLMVAYPANSGFGIDIDLDALALGRRLSNGIRFACARAEGLPFRDGTFDMVIARVSLVYSDLDRAIAEIQRVLKQSSTVWITLHPFSLCWRQCKKTNVKGWARFTYIILNSLLFHFAQRHFSLRGRYESFSTRRGIERVLTRHGFVDVSIVREPCRYLVSARRGARETAY